MATVAKLQRICKERQVRFETFFDMFDRLHTKRCSPSEMARAMSLAGVTLSAEDVAELCERYADATNPGMVNFQGLCDDVDSVFVLKGLESDPKSPVETLRVPRSPELSSSVDNNERELAKSALMVVARHSRVNGVVVNDFFKDFDYNRCGAIPRDEFLRCLNQLDGSIEPLAAQALAKCYTQVMPNGMPLVAYRRLHDDVTDPNAYSGSAMSRLTRDGLKYNEMVNPEAPHWWQHMDVSMLEDQLATLMAQYRIGRSSSASYFQPFDKYRTGCVPATRFAQALRSMFPDIPFTQDMISALTKAFAARPDTAAAIQSSSNAAGQAVNYALFLRRLYAKLGRAGGHAGGMGESLDDDALGGGAFGDGIGAHFAGLSPTGNVPLSPLGGGNGMGGSGFFSSNSPKSFADMSMNFDDPAAAMNGGGRNGFLPEMGAANDAPVLSAPPKVSLLGNHTMDPAHSIKRTSALAQRLATFSNNFKKSTGSPEKSPINGENFFSTSMGDGDRGEGVGQRGKARSQTPAFGVGGRNRDGTTTRLAFKRANDAALSPEEEYDAKAIVARISNVVRAKRLDLKWKLQDFDWKGGSSSTQHEHVTSSQLARALSELNLLSVPPDAEINLLTRLYAPTDGRHAPGQYVNYRRFLMDVDSTYGPHLHQGSIREDGEDPAITQAPGRSRPAPLRDQLDLLEIQTSTTIGGPPRELASVLAGLAAHCATKAVRLHEFFEDGDPMRSGRIPRSKLRQSLGACGYPLPNDKEFQALAAALELPQHPSRDAAGQPMLDWTRLVAEVARRVGEGDEAADTQMARSAAPGPRAYGDAAARHQNSLALKGGRSTRSRGGDIFNNNSSIGGSSSGGMNMTSFGSSGSAAAGFMESFGADFGEAASAQADEYALETAAALDEIARLCKVRRLDIRQSFCDFDRQNRGLVSAAVFDRVLSLCGVRPSRSQAMQGLLRKFADNTADSRVDVNYKAFAAAIAALLQGRASSGFEVESTAQFRASTANQANFFGDSGNQNEGTGARSSLKSAGGANSLRFAALSSPSGPVPRGGLQGVLLELALQLRAKKGRLVDFFRDGDPRGVGNCTPFKFRSALGRAGLAVDDNMFQELAQAFAYNAGSRANNNNWNGNSSKIAGKTSTPELMNWRKFIEALNDAKQAVGDGSIPATDALGGTNAFTGSSSSANNAQSFMATAGGGHSGAFPDISGSEFGGSRPGTGGGFGVNTTSRGMREAGGAEAETEDLLDAIADIVSTRRLLVKPFFQDLDRCRSNQVTRPQMGSVISQNVGLDLTPYERDLLFDAFRVVDGKGEPTDRFDYKQFVKRVDPVEIC